MFSPPVGLASLSGRSDPAWAKSGIPYIGCAFLGGIAICSETRRAARSMVERDREEFLPEDPFRFIEECLSELESSPIRSAINVRSIDRDALARVADLCRQYDAILEINAHCRQDEMCGVGVGESLLEAPNRLRADVAVAADCGVPVSVKVRAELPNVDLAETAVSIEEAGAQAMHVDAMDSPDVIAEVARASDLFVIANNGVRDATSTTQYLNRGADAVSIGRAWDRPSVLREVCETILAHGGHTIDRKPSLL